MCTEPCWEFVCVLSLVGGWTAPEVQRLCTSRNLLFNRRWCSARGTRCHEKRYQTLCRYLSEFLHQTSATFQTWQNQQLVSRFVKLVWFLCLETFFNRKMRVILRHLAAQSWLFNDYLYLVRKQKACTSFMLVLASSFGFVALIFVFLSSAPRRWTIWSASRPICCWPEPSATVCSTPSKRRMSAWRR